jgi:hypothetical protein
VGPPQSCSLAPLPLVCLRRAVIFAAARWPSKHRRAPGALSLSFSARRLSFGLTNVPAATRAGIKIGGPNQNPWGWFDELPANEALNARHQVGVTPCDLPREGWTRNYDNPHVCDLREYLKENNGIKGLEICEPHEVEKAARIFHRDGFVAVKDCLSPEILARMRATTDRAIMQAIESGPPRTTAPPHSQASPVLSKRPAPNRHSCCGSSPSSPDRTLNMCVCV